MELPEGGGEPQEARYRLSGDKERYILLGLIGALRVLAVVHCERQDGDVIRLISARRAMRPEHQTYTD